MTEQRVNAQPGERESVAESPGHPIVNAFGQTVGFVRSHGNYVKCGGSIPVYELSTVLGEPPVRRLTEAEVRALQEERERKAVADRWRYDHVPPRATVLLGPRTGYDDGTTFEAAAREKAAEIRAGMDRRKT